MPRAVPALARLSACLLVALVAPASTPSALAQEEAPSPQRIQRLMTEAYAALEAGNRLRAQAEGLEGAAAEAKRTEARTRYGDALTAYQQVLAGVDALAVPEERKAATRQVALYNSACARSLRGEEQAALDALARALEAGFDDFDLIAKDPDLEPIRASDGAAERFERLLTRAKARLAEAARAEGRKALASEALFPYDFEVQTLAGETLRLSDLRGKVVIVDYWGTWCPPCRMEIPHFVKLREELRGRVEVVGMTWEHGQAGPEAVAKVRAFAEKMGVEYPLTLLSDRADLRKVPDLRAFPTTLFVDKEGRVRAKEVGYRDYEALRGLVEALLAEEAPAQPEGQGGEGSRYF